MSAPRLRKGAVKQEGSKEAEALTLGMEFNNDRTKETQMSTFRTFFVYLLFDDGVEPEKVYSRVKDFCQWLNFSIPRWEDITAVLNKECSEELRPGVITATLNKECSGSQGLTNPSQDSNNDVPKLTKAYFTDQKGNKDEEVFKLTVNNHSRFGFFIVYATMRTVFIPEEGKHFSPNLKDKDVFPSLHLFCKWLELSEIPNEKVIDAVVNGECSEKIHTRSKVITPILV
jgi:hypothetical protein